MAIWFKKEDPLYGCLSNFYIAPIDIEGRIYKTTEHYYQAMKASTLEEHDYIAAAETPKESRDRGRNCQLRDGWEQMKEHVMKIALATKFTQHANLRQILLESDDEELIEWAPWDGYWGSGANGNGKNRLGVLLMELRTELRSRNEEI